MGIKLSTVTTLAARNTSIWQVRLQKANIAWHCSAKSCSQFCMCCSTARHYWTLISHIIHVHVNKQICNIFNALFSRMQRILQKCKQNFGGELSIITTPDWCSSGCVAQHLGIVEPWPHVPIPTHVNTQMCNPLQCTIFEEAEHPWIGYASILGVSCPPLLHWCLQCYMCCSTALHYSTLSSQYTNMPSFAMHRFQVCKAWLKSL